MSNAERQRRYRDRLRGAPPVGRWAGHVTIAKIATAQGVSRTMVVMTTWIIRNAPDEAPALDAGRARVTPTYRRLRREFDGAVVALLRRTGDLRDQGKRVVVTRRRARFVAKWVRS